ncbi:cytochrome C, partial [bacterium]
MPQIFHPSTNTFSKVSIFGAVFFLAGLAWAAALFSRSSYVTRVNMPVEQPVQFSHEHHVAGLGIDCRYCHTTVEESQFADIPPLHTCMTCHSQIWVDSPALEPVRESYRTGEPLAWNRVHDVPDFVYFNHEIHVAKGVGCETCHGPVDEMPLTWKSETLYMEWCLDCHRAPERYIRPVENVFDIGWTPPEDQLTLGRR